MQKFAHTYNKIDNNRYSIHDLQDEYRYVTNEMVHG